MQKTRLYKRCLCMLAALMLMLPVFSLAEDQMVVRGGMLNLRKEASLESDVLAQYPTGTWMTIVEAGETWSKVKVNGRTGYVMTKYLTADSAAATLYVRTNTGANLNMRTLPSLEGDILGSYAPGTAVSVLLRGNGWHKVNVSGQTGYMSSRFLAASASASGSQTSTSGYPKTGVVNNPKSTQVLLLRETASTDARVLGYYGNGVSVKLTGESNGFYKVVVDGRNGYMMKKFIKVTGASSSSPAASFPKAPFQATLRNPNGGSVVNFRRAAGMNTSIIKAYPVGTEVTVTAVGENWCNVTINEVEGFVSTYFLKVVK